MTKLEGSIGS